MLRKAFLAGKPKDASKVRVGIVVSEFNSDITEHLLLGALTTLTEWKVREKNITAVRVPGSFEIPLGAARLAASKKYDCIIAIGCILKGETKHDEYIAHAVAEGLMRVMLDTGVPVAFGVITPNSLAQARIRSRGATNHASFAARAALEMALVN